MTKQHEKAYLAGMVQGLTSYGLSKSAAQKASDTIVELKKKASMFNFSDSNDYGSGGFEWSRVIVPLLAAAAAGYVGYQARDKGHSDLPAFENIKNYFAGIGNKYIRRSRPRPLYDIRRYINN